MLPLEATYAVAETCSCLHVQAADDWASRGLSGSQVRALCQALRRLSTTRPSVQVSSAQ
jgi:hypothetical protein